MNDSSPDPFHGLNPADLMAAAAMPTDGGADTIPLQRADLPSLEEIAAAFPDLEILGLIGHGGMSAVFKARQPKLDRIVALKVLPKSLAATPGFAERFNREGRVLARLSHPSIVAVHDFGESGGFAYLIMEFVDGVNLRQAMRAGRFTPEQALRIIPAICDALQFAHTQGVLHRDIKPENILLDSKGRVKIADFGIAKILDEKGGDAMLLTQSGAKLGTAPYMAPEQIEQPSSVDHRADIYSLGVVFYEMLTGELPLGRFAAPSEIAAVGGNIDEIVFRALEKERARRQQSAGEFKTQLENLGSMSAPVQRALARRFQSFEYKSKRTLFGMPLLHVTQGVDPATGEKRVARGFFAFGEIARGVFAFGGYARGWFACGGMAVGGVAIGGLSIGLISWGGLALALLLAVGGLSIGPLATGGAALGWNAMGGIAAGWDAVGGLVIAQHGMGGKVIAPDVVKSLAEMPRALQLMSQTSWLTSMGAFLWLPLMLPMMLVPWWARRRLELEAAGMPHESSNRVFWIIPAVLVPGAVLWWMIYRWAQTGGGLQVHYIFATITECIGLLLFVLSLPLWLRLVPMNSFYGVRLPSTFASDKRWYDVNAYFGKQSFIWSLALMIAGMAGFYQLPRHQDSYCWAAITFSLVAIAACVISTLWWMRKHPADGSAPKRNRIASWSGQAVIALVIAMFIKSFIAGAYRVPQGNEPGVVKNSHWLASHLDTGFTSGDLILFEHESGHTWIARVVAREEKGLMLKRGGSPDEFFVPWNKIVGKMLFSHFSPDALPPSASSKAVQTSPESYVEVLEGTQHWDESQPPELRYVQLKRRGDKTWQDEVYDTLGRQVQDAQALRQVKESFPDLIHTSDPAHADERMVQLWFEHADFDGRSLLEIHLLDEFGQPLRLAHGRAGGKPLSVKQPPLRSCSLVLGRKEQLPRHITVELGFSTGPWELSNKVSPQFQGEEMLKGVAGFVTATGNDKEGRAFISWHNENLFMKQVGCYAILKSGRKIGHWEGAAYGSMVDARLEKYRAPGSREVARLESVNFQVPLSDVETFQIRHRLLRWEIYRKIVLPSMQ
ncbi:MAG: protein kinase [Verrucomicrobiaceae bacterium]|nr:protein kinase [Verrucomicrobiaceae bacterium]